MSREAVITGIGVITSAGIGTHAFWNNVCSAKSFIAPITTFDTTKFSSKVAGIVTDFQASDYLHPRLIAQTDRWTQFDLVCVQQAIADARLNIPNEDPTRVGAVFAAGTGGNAYGQKQLHLCWQKGPKAVSVYLSIAWFYAASLGQVSIRDGVRGYGRNICAEAAGGLLALGHAAKIIDHGLCDVVIVSGSEAPFTPFTFASHQMSGLLSLECALFPYKPFDATRSGTILGEGGAAFCVESKEHALQRGAHIYASIAGCGQTFDGVVTREPASDGVEYARAISQALSAADIQPSSIDWIICDGLGTRDGDISEVRALHHVFADSLAHIPASAPKSMFGRLCNGGSTVDVAAALLGLQFQVILPTTGYMHPDPECPIDCVPKEARSARVQQVLIGARGFGGFNAALALKHDI